MRILASHNFVQMYFNSLPPLESKLPGDKLEKCCGGLQSVDNLNANHTHMKAQNNRTDFKPYI